MGRKTAKMLGLVLAGSMVISMTSPVADAAAKMSLSKKKITITQGEKVTLKVKKATKKVSTTKLTKTIRKLKKKKTYYIKARAYKLDGKTKVYGKWSLIKKVVIKK